MKKILILITTLLFSIPVVTNANVDATNSFNFTYECKDWQWELKTIFSLWWHHSYVRYYKINQAWVLEIWDKNHTTLHKSANVSIPWCWDAGKCNIDDYWEWKLDLDWKEIDFITLEVDADLPDWNIRRNWNIITIENITKVPNTDDFKDLNFKLFWEEKSLDKEIKTNERLIKIDFSEEGKIIVRHWEDEDNLKELLSTTKVEWITYSWKRDIRFDVSSDNKKIILKKTPLIRENTWSLIEWKSQLYYAHRWINDHHWYYDAVWPDWLDNNYAVWNSTGLYKWPWNNSPYSHTTTNVRVHPSSEQYCREIEYNYKDKDVIISWTINDMTEPEFSGPVNINWVVEGNWWVTIYAAEELEIKNLRYKTVWKIWKKPIWVNRIEVSIKTMDNLTHWKQEVEFARKYETPWAFQDFKIRLPEVTAKLKWKEDWKDSWRYQIVFTMFNDEQQVWTHEFPLTIVPNNDFLLKDTNITKNSVTYANGEDTIRLCQDFTDSFWNLIKREISSGNKNKPSIIKNIKSNEFIGKKDNSVETISNKNILISNIELRWDSKFCFDISKLTPWDLWKISIYIPTHKANTSLDLNWNSKNFVLDFWDNWESNDIWKNAVILDLSDKKLSFANPFNSKIEVKNLDWKTWNWIPDVARNQNYRLVLENIGKLKDITAWSLTLNKNSVKIVTPWQVWEDFKTKDSENKFTISSSSKLSKDNFLFDARIDVDIKNTDNKTAALDAPKVSTDNIMVRYNIKWKTVTYPLVNSELEWCKKSTLWVKVEWIIQSDWKGDMTWQEENFSDLSKSTMRWVIRKNAFTLITWMKSGQVLNWIKYVQWDVSDFSDIDSYETLIIKDWNLIINSDLNTKGNKLWIIVLKDNYNINTDYWRAWNKWAWNVFISWNVKTINATIYADWTMRSANADWTIIDDSNILDPLELTWSLFTRNTIGWSLRAWVNYTLPGGQITSNFELASMFDLNAVRKTPICWEDDYAFLIKYDARLQTNPPKWFSAN